MQRIVLLTGLACLLAGCSGGKQEEVVVYCALDREFSEPMLKEFEQATQITPLAKYDVESTKTVGLVNAIIQEQNRPRCDVFWNNEILHTLRLQKLGLLEPYTFPGSDDWPENYRAADGTWYGLAARARVIVVNTELVKPHDYPRSIYDLADPKWKDRCGLAKPLFGTTATHAAVLFAALGEEKVKELFLGAKGNAQVLAGNKQVALAVGRGQLAWGLTDTDDAIIEKEQGRPVEIIYPDQQEGGLGTLFIPNSIVILKGAPHPDAARRLAAWVLSAESEVEKKLAAGPSAQFPLNPQVSDRPRVAPEEEVRWMEADFAAAAEQWDAAAAFLRDHFTE